MGGFGNAEDSEVVHRQGQQVAACIWTGRAVLSRWHRPRMPEWGNHCGQHDRLTDGSRLGAGQACDSAVAFRKVSEVFSLLASPGEHICASGWPDMRKGKEGGG